MGDTALGPGFERHQQTLFVEFTELLGLWTEACPDANHEVCMLLVNILNHLWAINKVF